MQQRTGVVKFFNDVEGWGIIFDEELGDVHVHWKAVPGEPGTKNLQRNDIVLYVPGKRKDGYFALKVISFTRS